MITPVLLLSAMLLSQDAATPQPGLVLWPKGVPPNGADEKDAFGNHTLSLSTRDKDGVAEVHANFADLIVIQTGTATLVVGGTVLEPKPTEPGETRGTSIQDGTKRTVAPGDVIHIAAGTPHQFFVAPGHKITYVLVKIAAK